jgi:Flp pilus assembly protein TadG
VSGPAGSTREDRTRARRSDSGNAALELVILAPLLLALLSLVIAAGRTTVAQGSVDAAARDAARQASIALTPESAQTAGLVSARAALRRDGLDCSPAVVIDTRQFTSVPVGRPAAITAVVSCAVPLANLALPGLPGTARLSATFTSPLDTYRSRSNGFAELRATIHMYPSMERR